MMKLRLLCEQFPLLAFTLLLQESAEDHFSERLRKRLNDLAQNVDKSADLSIAGMPIANTSGIIKTAEKNAKIAAMIYPDTHNYIIDMPNFIAKIRVGGTVVNREVMAHDLTGQLKVIPTSNAGKQDVKSWIRRNMAEGSVGNTIRTVLIAPVRKTGLAPLTIYFGRTVPGLLPNKNIVNSTVSRVSETKVLSYDQFKKDLAAFKREKPEKLKEIETKAILDSDTAEHAEFLKWANAQELPMPIDKIMRYPNMVKGLVDEYLRLE